MSNVSLSFLNSKISRDQDALIGVPGAILTVEQRKRLTISVELRAKPSILLFLDESTSGLDGQSSFNIVRFLKGGKTVYFGETSEDSSILLDYF